jgi:ATP-dependent RNA helicase UAP56/SUB2
MGEPYPKTEEILDYEEEEEAAPDAVAAKTNGETVKK